MEGFTSESRELELEETAADELKSGEDHSQVKEEVIKEESEPSPASKSDTKADGEKAPPSESSCELNNSCDSVSLEQPLSAGDAGPLHIVEREDSPVTLDTKPNGLENGGVSGFNSDTKDPNIPHKVCHFISTHPRYFLCILCHDSAV